MVNITSKHFYLNTANSVKKGKLCFVTFILVFNVQIIFYLRNNTYITIYWNNSSLNGLPYMNNLNLLLYLYYPCNNNNPSNNLVCLTTICCCCLSIICVCVFNGFHHMCVGILRIINVR